MKTSQLEERLGTDAEFDEKLISDNESPELSTMISDLMREKNITRAELIKRMDIDRSYGYQLLNGTRLPTRIHIIHIGLALGLDIEQFQRLMKTANKKPLYVRDMFDARVFYAVKHKMPLDKAMEFIGEI